MPEDRKRQSLKQTTTKISEKIGMWARQLSSNLRVCSSEEMQLLRNPLAKL